MLKQDKLQGLIFECKEGASWTSSLFLISSDYSIIVVTKESIKNKVFSEEFIRMLKQEISKL